MYRPSTYDKSQISLMYFADIFNACPVEANIRWEYIRTETYDNDGCFLDIETGRTFGFDWEIRDKYFANGVFSFSDLRQFERKLQKPSIKLSLQGDSTCTAILAAWHEDFLKGDRIPVSLSTDYAQNQTTYTRATKEFKVYKLEDMPEFKKMIARSLRSEAYNHTVF